MSKLRKSILIIGILIIAVAASLGTALALYATGSLKTDPIELVYVIKPESKEYDGTPLKAVKYRLESGELVSGHVADVKFIGEQTDVGASESDLSVKIYDEEGFDVSDRYTIKVEKSTLAVTPKYVKVEMPSQKVVYNGSKVNFTEYNIAEDSGNLVSGHVLAGSSENAALLNVGDTLPDDIRPLVFDKAGKDVTYNYEIDCEMGEIEIIPRPVSVRPVSKTKVYDGTVLISDEIEFLEGTLVEGQYAEFTINGGYDDRLIGVDSIITYVKNFKVYAQVGGETVDVTSNYEVDAFESGTLSVTPRLLTVVAKSGVWEYDGMQHSFINDDNAEEVEGLAPTDSIVKVHYLSRITDVGKIDNIISSVDFTCDENNYDITLVKGTLEVYPFALHVITGSGEKYYDGEPLSTSVLETLKLAST
ncbi:MAG: hypothetical protein K2O67_03330, partial [Clostridia bacterium]|nr:hypothetical protein [Clostridia bacterium]